MTSKDSIENIKNILREDENIWEYNEDIKQIEKDLEVLELIKKKNVATFLIPCCNTARDYSMKTSGFEALTDKEFKLLKEWLENDSNKNKSVNSES